MRAITHLPVVKAVGFLAILLLCGLAQAQFLNGSAWGYPFLILAGIFAWLVIAPISASPSPANTLDVARGLRRWFGLIILLIGLGCVVYSATGFSSPAADQSHTRTTYPWFFFALGLGLAFVGSLLLVGIGRLPELDWTVILLIAVLALALSVRIFQVDQYPFGVWFDEAIYGLHVRNWLTDPNFRPIFVDNITYPHLLLDVIALQLWGGTNVAGLRIVSAVLASLGLIPAYLIGRELRGRWFGLLHGFSAGGAALVD